MEEWDLEREATTTAMTEVMTEEEPGAMEVQILTTGEFSCRTDLSSWETTVTVMEICTKISNPTTQMKSGIQSRTKAQERTQTIVKKRVYVKGSSFIRVLRIKHKGSNTV